MWYPTYVFPRLIPVPRFPTFGTSMFSRAWLLLHVFPRLALVACCDWFTTLLMFDLIGQLCPACRGLWWKRRMEINLISVNFCLVASAKWDRFFVTFVVSGFILWHFATRCNWSRNTWKIVQVAWDMIWFNSHPYFPRCFTPSCRGHFARLELSLCLRINETLTNRV